MTRVIRNIINAVKSAVAGTTPATDASMAPSAFVEVADGGLEATSLDRGFVVLADGGAVANYVNVPGSLIADATISLRVHYLNEGRSETDAQALVFEDAERLMQRVVRTVHDAAVTGLNAFEQSGAFTISTLGDTSRRILSIPFSCNYVDDVLTT